MKVFVLGGGGREHALGYKLAQSSSVEELFFLPGNAGTASLGQNIPISPVDAQAVLDEAKRIKPGLIVVGPEAPLFEGVSDILQEQGFRVFGPDQKSAMLEKEKTFAKQFMKRYSVPTAAFEIFSDAQSAKDYVSSTDGNLVIKASGPALGKGVILTDSVEDAVRTVDEIMIDRRFGDAGKQIVIEEKLTGEEISIHILTDGIHYISFPPAQDHKPIGDGDTGPNTGGMGAYAPAPLVDAPLLEQIEDEVIAPVLSGLQQERMKYRGALFIGLMITSQGPKVLEFNCRFGDPETQPLMMLVDEDLPELLLDTARGNLVNRRVRTRPGAALCVVAASGGYPSSYQKGKHIVLNVEQDDSFMCFHAGTKIVDGGIVTSGGRVLGVTAYASDLEQARQKAYLPLESGKVNFEKIYYRKDIGDKGLEKLRFKD